jgi:hypothetical protein
MIRGQIPCSQMTLYGVICALWLMRHTHLNTAIKARLGGNNHKLEGFEQPAPASPQPLNATPMRVAVRQITWHDRLR